MSNRPLIFFLIFLGLWFIAPRPLVGQAAADNNLIISEVQISGGPGKTDNDFIEIYNPTKLPIDLKGWRLVKRTAVGAYDQTIKAWTNSTVIKPAGYYLWVNKNFVELINQANTSTTAILANDNGIALRHGPADAGQIIDSVAWGKVNNGLGEGSEMLANPPVGHSWQRIKVNDYYQDTQNNSADFFLQTYPNPQADMLETIAVTGLTGNTALSNNQTIAAPIIAAPQSTPLSKVSLLKSGDKIYVEGVVAAVPGEISPTAMFLIDEFSAAGLQLNLSAGAPAEIKRGQKVGAEGSVSKTLAYGTRLSVKSADHVVILGNTNEPLSKLIDIKNLDQNYEGWLITTGGNIVQRGSNWFVLENNSARLRVNLRNSAHNWPKLASHQHIEITGFITLNQGELRLWPRSPNDIVVNQPSSTETAGQIIDLSPKKKLEWRGYLLLVVLALVILASWAWEKKKLPAGVIKFIRRYFDSQL